MNKPATNLAAARGSAELLERHCSFRSTVEIVLDSWSFLILREGWFGVRRYDEMREKLGIASNVLADRLARLVDAGVLAKTPYGSGGGRQEYRFTRMGRDLYKPMIVMMAWGDRWLNHGRPPLRLRHRPCGNDFVPIVVCDQCHEPIAANEADYELRYERPVP